MSHVADILASVLDSLGEVPAEERGRVFSSLITELLNAGGLTMDGSTIQSSLPQSPAVVEGIATLLGVNATTTRNKYSVYPFARASLSASGPCYYICAETGELMILLTRILKNSEQWFYAAGYMEVLPPNAEMIYTDRVSEAVRNKVEEATVGVHLAAPAERDAEPPPPGTQRLPRQRPLTQLIHDEFKRLSALERWDMAIARLSDPDYLRALFKRHAVEWPANMDISTRDTFIRETWEETGFDLHAYPQALIQLTRSLNVSIVGGIARLYNIDQLYYAYLGVLPEPPALESATTECVEATWMPLSSLSYDMKRNQYMSSKDGRPLHFTAVRGIEYTLLSLLDYFIERVSQVRKSTSSESVPLFSNTAGVQAALIGYAAETYPEINALLSITLGPEKTLPGMMHAPGQEMFRSFIAAAKGLAMREDAKTLEERIARAVAAPAVLAELVK